jgi:uncharacterized repeat protein (TIGR02543 family)
MTTATTVTATFNLTGPGPGTFYLQAVTIGSGTGDVSSTPAGIHCGGGASCGAMFTSGSTVTLTAVASPGSTFVGWGYDCAGAGSTPTCALVMGGPHAVSAQFKKNQSYLGVTLVGSGRGDVSSGAGPGEINCPSTSCGGMFDSARTVTLTATPQPGYTFVKWTADCTAAGASPTCDLSMSTARWATAEFR